MDVVLERRTWTSDGQRVTRFPREHRRCYDLQQKPVTVTLLWCPLHRRAELEPLQTCQTGSNNAGLRHSRLVRTVTGQSTQKMGRGGRSSGAQVQDNSMCVYGLSLKKNKKKHWSLVKNNLTKSFGRKILLFILKLPSDERGHKQEWLSSKSVRTVMYRTHNEDVLGL